MLNRLAGIGVLVTAVLGSVLPYPDASTQTIESVKQWARKLPAEGEAAWSARFSSRHPSPSHWNDGSVYQVLVDRFNNGNASNDDANLSEQQKNEYRSGNLNNVHSYRHGGDLKGIKDRLDYIEDLGMTQIWLSPIFLNKNGDYHGYCVSDFLQLDPGFGSLEDLQDLVSEAHERGILVLLDIVVNHMCDPETRYTSKPTGSSHYRCADDQSTKNWNGGSYAPSGQGSLSFGSDHFAPFKSPYFFNRCGTNSHDDMTGEGNAAVYGDFVEEMFDFDTNNHDWQEIFTEMQKYWIAAADVDGFRLDAVKHVTEQFITYFCPTVRDYANQLGKSNFFIVGEIAANTWWQGRFLGTQYSNPQNPNDHGSGRTNFPSTATSRMFQVKDTYLAHPVSKFPGLNSIYDFTHSGLSREVFRGDAGKESRDIKNYLYSSEHRNIAGQVTDPSVFWKNLEIHDWPRLLQGRWKDGWEMAISAHAYLAFSQGTPIVYYGAEQGFNGDCWWNSIDNTVGNAYDYITRICSGHSDGLYRQTMWDGAGYNLGSAIVKDTQRIGKPSGANPFSTLLSQDPFLRAGNLYRAVRKYHRVRQSCTPLRRGSQVFRRDALSLIAFSRIYAGEEIVVLVNPSRVYDYVVYDLDVDSAVNPRNERRTYRNVFGSQEATTYYSGNQAKLSFGGMQLLPGDVAVFVLDSRSGPWNNAIGARLCL